MSSEASNTTQTPPSRGRGRGKSRGGLGKYLRARGRGRGGGRPAEFHKRLVLEDEETVELEPDSEEAKELASKYARRQLGSNADRYAEPEPVLNSDGEFEYFTTFETLLIPVDTLIFLGEEEPEPELDLTSFLARQRLDDSGGPSLIQDAEDDSDVDQSLAHLVHNSSAGLRSHKGKVQSIEWDDGLEQIRREKEIADANRGKHRMFKLRADR